MKKGSVLTWTFLVILLFQNFDLVSTRVGLYVQSVDEESRVEHARELLGRSYQGSAAEGAEDKNSAQMALAIYEEFHKNLPKADKWQAAPLANLVIEQSEKFELDPVFVMAVIAQESSFRTKARGPVGEIGLMQLRPETAAWIAKKNHIPFYGAKTLEQPFVNVKIGIAYVAHLREAFDGKANNYVSAYNMGARNVRRMVASRHLPHDYSTRVMKHYKEMYQSMAKKTVVIAKE